jgi:hypothetical protein
MGDVAREIEVPLANRVVVDFGLWTIWYRDFYIWIFINM